MYMDENWEPVFETPAPNGAAFLDKQMPGWADKINLDDFSIVYPWNCVLGQLYGDYLAGVKTVGLTEEHAARDYGFDRCCCGGTSDYTYKDLEKEWMFLIEQRKTAPVDS